MAVDLASPRSPQDTQKIRQVFSAIGPESCPTDYNFHMHTVFSDGQMQPEELAEQAVRNGLRGFAITDHHSASGFRKAHQWLTENAPANAPHLWSGVEVNAGLLNCEVHILCYGFDPDHRAMQPYIRGHSVSGDRYAAGAIINAVHEAKGLTVLAHPSRYRQPATELVPEAVRLGIDGIETYYAYDNPVPWRPSPHQTAIAHELGERHGLLHTCGTDTHGLSLLQRL